MVYNRRRRSKQLHFSDGPSRFDNKRERPRKDAQPLSPSFSRKVMRCKRCGVRIVSNVDHCPYCGKNLRPVFMRLWFWLIIVVSLAASVTYTIVMGIPDPEPIQPVLSSKPVVVGAKDGTSFKNLTIGTTIDVDNLLVTITGVEQGPAAKDGSSVKIVTALFSNKRADSTTLLSTQWRIERSDGTRDDTYIGITADGETISSNFEAYQLEAGKQFTGRLYFSGDDLAKIVFSPNALDYNEDNLATWSIPQSQNSQSQSSESQAQSQTAESQ